MFLYMASDLCATMGRGDVIVTRGRIEASPNRCLSFMNDYVAMCNVVREVLNTYIDTSHLVSAIPDSIYPARLMWGIHGSFLVPPVWLLIIK